MIAKGYSPAEIRQIAKLRAAGDELKQLDKRLADAEAAARAAGLPEAVIAIASDGSLTDDERRDALIPYGVFLQ